MHLTSDIALVQWYDNSFVTMECLVHVQQTYGARPNKHWKSNSSNRQEKNKSDNVMPASRVQVLWCR